MDTDTWQDGLNGGLLGITDLLLRAHVMATYLNADWGRTGARCAVRHHRRRAAGRDSTSATATRSGLWTPGRIRIEA